MMRQLWVCARHLGGRIDDHTPARRMVVELRPVGEWPAHECSKWGCAEHGVYRIEVES